MAPMVAGVPPIGRPAAEMPPSVVSQRGSTPENREASLSVAQEKSWAACWSRMVVRDLHGYPMWETRLQDVLRAVFPELQLIFVHYCGSSVQGSASIGNATKIGLMEMLTFATDAGICTPDFKVDELTRHFWVSNMEAALAASGSADRHRMSPPGRPTSARRASPSRTMSPSRSMASPRSGASGSPHGLRRGSAAKATADQQLNLCEFINFLVRVAFWRANPQWGLKHNRRELTPVPESVEILLEECVLPRAKRDTSAEFRKALAADAATLSVLADYEPKLLRWLRRILHKYYGCDYWPDLKIPYSEWINLMDGPGGEGVPWSASDEAKRRARSPKMVGEWFLSQESEITGDERTAAQNVLTFKAALSIPQVRWNFLRSQAIEQLQGFDAGKSEVAYLDTKELLECIARCAVDTYAHPMRTYLPSHGRKVMSMASATRSFLQTLLWEKSHERCMWEATIITAVRYDWRKHTEPLADHSTAEHRLWCHCWESIVLVDLHHFPLWERGVHDCLQQHFPVLMRIFSYYTKGISGIDSVADALEMELEEFHDFVKDAKLETRLVDFTRMTNVFAKADASKTLETFEHHRRERRNPQVVQEQEIERSRQQDKAELQEKAARREGIVRPVHEAMVKRAAGTLIAKGADRPSSDRPTNRLTLTEFLGCLVRVAFLRANPTHGQWNNTFGLAELPGCLRRMLEDSVLPNAKQDTSSAFRAQLASNADVQAVFREYRDRLGKYYEAVCVLKHPSRPAKSEAFDMDVWISICSGFIRYAKGRATKVDASVEGSAGQSGGLGKNAIVGDCTVTRESDITGDERCKETFTCRLSMLEAKYAFLHSQSLEQMASGDVKGTDAMANLGFDEFLECLARCARDKYGEIELMSLADGVRGIIQNLLSQKSDEAVIRDATYIHAHRYKWQLTKPLPGQSDAAHRKWLDCWQNVEIADLHHFPLWEKGVHDCLQEAFADLSRIFAHYSKSIGGSTTAEDAVEMTMTEFKHMVKDVGLDTKDFSWEVITSIFKKANALHSNAAHFQRKEEAGTACAKLGSTTKAIAATRKLKSAASQKDLEKDQELVLYEFVEMLVRISFARANPFFGLRARETDTIKPLSGCLEQLLQQVVLPKAKKDDSAQFREQFDHDRPMQAVLASYERRLVEWFNVHSQAMFNAGKGRVLQFQQWQDLLKHGDGSAKFGVPGFTPGNEVGDWQIYQDSEITGDERCRNVHKVRLSMAQAKAAFVNSQPLDQLTVGQAKDTDAMTTLAFDEFKECIARCALDKYSTIKRMTAPVMIASFVRNLLGEANTEECINEATLIRAERFNWKRYSQPVDGQSVKQHRKWLQVWQRLEISGVHYFPLWEREVHDLLQKHFSDIFLIFLAYCRSLLGSDTAEDAMEMEMAEFKDFVDECRLETKFVNFDRMTNAFIKANATNSDQVRDAHHESRRSAGTKMDGRTTAVVSKVKATNDGEEAKRDQELVLYEFIALLVRIAFTRANPTFGNFGSKAKEVVHLPGCLQRMLEEEILPRARRDTSSVFRDTVMADLAVKAALAEYTPKLQTWYRTTCADEKKTTSSSTDQLQMEQFMAVCTAQKLVGIWDCYRESDVTGDPKCKTHYSWRLSLPQVRRAFMDSQPADQLGAAQSSTAAQSDGKDAMAVLDFREFLECCARLGVDKYRGVSDLAPADAVRGWIQNLLGEASADEVVVRATYVHAARYRARLEAQLLPGETTQELSKWLACWERVEIMDVHLWPLWEKEVHDILHPLFKELQLIFLAYTRSISEDSAEDAVEMSMDEFHDFVVDVGLETKAYKFDVMVQSQSLLEPFSQHPKMQVSASLKLDRLCSQCNQFVKANAVNTAQARAQRHEEKRDAQSREHDRPEWQKRRDAPDKVKGGSDGKEALKDQELVLFEFLNMLVRIAFWRANPHFGLWKDVDGDRIKDQETIVAVPLALSQMLNDIILPRAKREQSAAFREKEMSDPLLRRALELWSPKLRTWFDRNVGGGGTARSKANRQLLGFEPWLRVLTNQKLVGEWEVEQLSEITGDQSTKGNLRIRLSIITCKAAFMDSQRVEQLEVGQSTSGSEMAALDFDEWLECLARIGTAKYSAIKQLTNAQRVEAFIKNFLGEQTEEECMHQATYIRADRFDVALSRPLQGESSEAHITFLAEFKRLQLDNLYGFPLWESEVHDLLHVAFTDLAAIFRAYCWSLGEKQGTETAKTMDLEEFHDFVVDVGLETTLRTNATAAPAVYKFEQMKAQFKEANRSGKGLKGPAADGELLLHEFLSLLVRISFHRLNPEYGERVMEHQDTLLPVPQCLEQTLKQSVLPKSRREDDGKFRQSVMALPDVQYEFEKARPRLHTWFGGVQRDEKRKVGLAQWLATLKQLNVLGTFTSSRESDIVGDDRAGVDFKCRLSVPHAKAAFVLAQTGDMEEREEATSLDFDELLECIARCGVDKYRSISEMKTSEKVAAMIANLLGDRSTEQVMHGATYIHAQRFRPPERSPLGVEWVTTWSALKLSELPGFPVWEKQVHDELAENFKSLRSIFRAYSASSLQGSARDMDLEEFQDFAIEADLATSQYGIETMLGQFTEANVGSKDTVLELHEFLTALVRISFFRANPQYGMRIGKDQNNADLFGAEKPLPTCLIEMLRSKVIPNARYETHQRDFEEKIWPLHEVQAACGTVAEELLRFGKLLAAGRSLITLEQWLNALNSRLLFSNLQVLGHPVRLSEPQAKAAFYAAASSPLQGLLPDELAGCAARCGVNKYRHVQGMSPGAMVSGFLANLLDGQDEEDVVRRSLHR